MRFHTAAVFLATAAASSSAFMAPMNKACTNLKVVTTSEDATTTEARPIYDPLNLYPESSPEKQQGRVKVMEPQLSVEKPIRDPVGLYPKESTEYNDALEQEQDAVFGQQGTLYDPMGLYSPMSPERISGRIQPMEPPVKVVKNVKDPMGLYPQYSDEFVEGFELERESIVSRNRQLYDPLGLYPASSAEYQEGRIQALEPTLDVKKPVLDPLNMYSSKDEVDSNVAMSQALPFLPRPAVLDGELAGDAGFDPLGFAKNKEDLLWQRQAELKHARIAMLAAAGWPIAELLHGKFAGLWHLKSLLVDGDRVPSLLNGGLGQINPFYWLGVVAVAGFVEALGVMNNNGGEIFDPLSLFPKDAEGQKRMEWAELRNGRLAMLAITAFAAMEAITGHGVV